MNIFSFPVLILDSIQGPRFRLGFESVPNLGPSRFALPVRRFVLHTGVWFVRDSACLSQRAHRQNATRPRACMRCAQHPRLPTGCLQFSRRPLTIQPGEDLVSCSAPQPAEALFPAKPAISLHLARIGVCPPGPIPAYKKARTGLPLGTIRGRVGAPRQGTARPLPSDDRQAATPYPSLGLVLDP